VSRKLSSHACSIPTITHSTQRTRWCKFASPAQDHWAPINGHALMGMAPQSEVAAFFRCAGDQGRHVQDRHDGGRGHHPSTARTGSHEPGKSLHKADRDEIQSPSTAACLRLFDRWTSLAPMPTTVMAKEGAGRGIVGAITLGAESGSPL
jgi:hypothetical protein